MFADVSRLNRCRYFPDNTESFFSLLFNSHLLLTLHYFLAFIIQCNGHLWPQWRLFNKSCLCLYLNVSLVFFLTAIQPCLLKGSCLDEPILCFFTHQMISSDGIVGKKTCRMGNYCSHYYVAGFFDRSSQRNHQSYISCL